MYNNISLEREKSALRDALIYLDKDNEEEKEIYKTFENCSKDDISEEKMIEDLKSLGDLKGFSTSFRNFVEARINELEFLQKQQKELKDLKTEIVEENKKLEQEFDKRNIDYKDDIEKQNQEEKLEQDLETTYLEENETKEELKQDLDTLKDKKKAVTNEKESGSEFDKKIENETKSDYINNSTHEDQINSIQEKAYENKKTYNNPSGDYVANCYNYYLENETISSKFDVKIDYKSNNEVEVKFGLKGTVVDEKIPRLSFNYVGDEQMTNFRNNVYPMLIEEHVIDSKTETKTESGHLESINSNDETLEVNGNDEEVLGAKEDIAKTVERKKGMVRKKEFKMPNNNGFNNNGIITIVLVSLIIVCLVVIFINLR